MRSGRDPWWFILLDVLAAVAAGALVVLICVGLIKAVAQ